MLSAWTLETARRHESLRQGLHVSATGDPRWKKSIRLFSGVIGPTLRLTPRIKAKRHASQSNGRSSWTRARVVPKVEAGSMAVSGKALSSVNRLKTLGDLQG